WGEGREVFENVETTSTPWERQPGSMAFRLPGLTALIYSWRPRSIRKTTKRKVPAASVASGPTKTQERTAARSTPAVRKTTARKGAAKKPSAKSAAPPAKAARKAGKKNKP